MKYSLVLAVKPRKPTPGKVMPEGGFAAASTLLMAMFPSYHLPRRFILSLALDWVRLHPRSFRADAFTCITTLSPVPSIRGRENIPVSGPYLITFNHYYRPGLNIWWLTMVILTAIPSDAHIIMTGELTYPGKWYKPLAMAVSRFVLKRLARIYGFTTMPPMPPREKDVTERAKSVRAALSHLDKTPDPILMLAPEGGDQPGGCLARPPAGVGRFISLMTDRGLCILPVAGWEQAGALFVRIGPSYRLKPPEVHLRHERDLYVSNIVMSEIARLMPEHLRGDFA